MALLKSPAFLLPFLILIFSITITFSLSRISGHSLQTIHDPKTEDFGFSSILIHRDSPESPTYNPNLMSSERIGKAVERTLSRMSFPGKGIHYYASTDIHGEYYMTYSVGTPPFEVKGLLDTGSQLIWMQCFPCKSKSGAKACGPISDQFDHRKSSTYRLLNCDYGACTYNIRYGDGQTYSKGNIAVDTLTFGDHSASNNVSIQVPDIVFGCGNDFWASDKFIVPGIIGLDMGPNSFLSQLSIKKFSYCLREYGGEIRFQSNAVLLDKKTPFYEPINGLMHFFMNLTDLSVGNSRLGIPAGTFNFNHRTGTGGFIIDSGTPYTCLQNDVFKMIVKKIREEVGFWRWFDAECADPEGLFDHKSYQPNIF